MNPIEITQTLQKNLVSYLTTTFDVNRDGQEQELADMMQASFNVPGALFNGPFLELTPPYKSGRTLNQLIEANILSTALATLPCFEKGRPIPLDLSLYTHQETAIRRLSNEQRSIVVSSGTGSGKTECFLIPILNDLLLDNTPGVRALLVYPMNALVNDQLDRLRVLLKDTDITFGRYTSELEQSEKYAREKLGFEPLPNEVICRDHIQSGEKIPQILITNYAMLEYLLLRPQDSILFQSGAWRFVVLDEAHTYAGAQGIEVAVLVRRLKHRLGKLPGDMRCIATSATLTDGEADKAIQFAENLFHEKFEIEDIIFGEPNLDFAPMIESPYIVDPMAYVHDDFSDLLQTLRANEGIDSDTIALQMANVGLIPEDRITVADRTKNGPLFLWRVLKDNAHIAKLRDWMLSRQDTPVRLEEAAQHVFGADIPDEDTRLVALYHLVELGALARRDEAQPPLIPARYHLFARPSQGLWACVNPQCSGRTTSADAGWSRLFSKRVETCDACECKTYPLVVCRECGQVYLHMEEDLNQFSPATNSVDGDAKSRYFTWRSIEENLGLGGEEGDEDEDEQRFAQPSNLFQEAKTLCISCGKHAQYCTCATPTKVELFLAMQKTSTKKGKKELTRDNPYESMNECPRCHSKAQPNTKIVTPVEITGTTPLSVIVQELYRHLPASKNPAVKQKPGEGRKLLTFYDSRQGAARFAAFLQDTANQQNYRHIIPKAACYIQQKEGFSPDLEYLSKQCSQFAWEYQIFHNDPDLTEWRSPTRHMSLSQRKRLMARTNAEIIAEFTTRRTQRQSLEMLGLVAVAYFENEALPDFSNLSTNTGFTEAQIRTLIEYLLDDLRKSKIVELPEDVNRDDPIFGRNRFSPRLVRGGQPGEHEESWLGKTERKRRRHIVKKMLAGCQLPDDNAHVEKVLLAIWEWFFAETDILTGDSANGYQLNNKRLYFNTNADWVRCDNCQRLSPRGTALPCPNVACTGHFKPYNASTRDNFFADLFERDIIPIRIEEHTAQLDSDKGRRYQDGFRDGNINVLSCSTTFEMGIDLGDLQAVAMSNVPPTVANYRQRSGRAGRRASGTAFILTWAANRPHDQTYFRAPKEIIRGHVRVPHFTLDNEFITSRHLNAILLSAFLRYQNQAGYGELKNVGAFFDHQTTNNTPHYAAVSPWLDEQAAAIAALLHMFKPALNSNGMGVDTTEWIKHFQAKLAELNTQYQETSTFYLKQIEEANRAYAPGGDKRANQEARDQIDAYEKLLNRLRDETLINYLSDRGLLPSYSFPLHSVELLLPPQFSKENLRLQRDLRQAIREYAPGSEIVADKRIWRSAGLQFYRETPRSRDYRLCDECGYLEISKEAGMPIRNINDGCPVCHAPYSKNARHVNSFVTPDGFRADWKNSGKPAKQYVISNRGRERAALIPPAIDEHTEQRYKNSLLHYYHKRDGELFYVNEGRTGKGYKICFTCGNIVADKDKTCKSYYKGGTCPGERIVTIALGHVQKTDTLHLRFEPTPGVPVPSPENLSFWLSLMYALIHGASRALQIERRDIDGVLYPRQSPGGSHWEQTIVLYDDVPGGAGHVKQIALEFEKVISEAIQILNCTDCAPDTSCTHCLRDYSNQFVYDDLRRQEALRFLETLYVDLQSDYAGIPGEGQVVALNIPHWLMRQVENTRESLYLAADSLSLVSPFGADRNWLDVLSDLRQRKIDVDLFLKRITIQRGDSASLSIAQHLDLLIDRGLRLWWIDGLPDWQVLIDPQDRVNCRAIRINPNASSLILDDHSGEGGLMTTIHPDGINLADFTNQNIICKKAERKDLESPQNVTVINITSKDRGKRESDFFLDVFSKPVVSLTVNDPYLFNSECIVDRLGAYIDLAAKQGVLENVTIYTKRAGQRGAGGTPTEQDRAFDTLEKRYEYKITRNYNAKKVAHDRFIDLQRVDGTTARIIIGKGLDFIRPDGTIDPTYIVIQDPCE